MTTNSPAPDNAADPPRVLLPARTTVGLRLRTALGWILTVCAPGVLLLVVQISVGPTVRIGLIGCIPVLMCLCTLWSALSYQRLSVTLGCGVAQLGCLYLVTLTAALLDEESPLSGTPGVLALAVVFFVVPTLVAALAMRSYRWRLIRKPTGDEVLLPLARRLQFQLAEVFAWITCTAVFLAMGTALISRFDVNPVGYGGFELLLLFVASAVLCIPTGALSLVLSWLILGQKHALARAITAAVIGISWLVFAGIAVSHYLPTRELDNLCISFVIALEIGLPLVAMLTACRLLGWRLVRLPVPT